jgi:hypothetical protein
MDKSMEDVIRYISGELRDNPKADRSKLIDEASQRFDLTPMQTEFLINKYVMNK